MNTFCIGKYPIGTQYMPIRKNTYVCTITDIHKTYNNNGDLVKTTYVATHEFCGQTITESNVNETTIARGIDNMKLKEKLAFNKEESKESHGPSGPNVDKQYAWPDDVEDDCYHMEEIL